MLVGVLSHEKLLLMTFFCSFARQRTVFSSLLFIVFRFIMSIARPSPSDVKRWMPLESNPDVLNAYISRMGFNVATHRFYDVLSTEEWALEMIPRPVVGVVMLFPIKDASEQRAHEADAHIAEHGQEVSENVYFMKQIVSNACGTVGVLHAIGNARDRVLIDEGSYLDRFYRTTQPMTPEQRAVFLNEDREIEETHGAAAEEGQTPADADVNEHFVCFSVVDGHLYELDGRRPMPINHGACAAEELLEKAIGVIKREYMEKDPDEIRFTTLALAANED